MKTALLVRKLAQFTTLSASDEAVLEAAGEEVITYASKQDIMSQGSVPDSVHLVMEGWAARYKTLPNGSRQIMALLIPGDLCDVQVTLLDKMDHSIGALTPCKVLHLSRKKLADLMRSSEQLQRALWWSTLVDEAILREWLVNLAGRPASQRLGHLICEMLLRSKAVGLGYENNFEMPLSQEELADTMGMSSVHMNRSLQDLRGQGLINSQGKRIFINDLAALMAFSGFDPIYLHRRQISEEKAEVEARRVKRL